MELVAPKVGLMDTMTVVQWLKQPGDRVLAAEALVVLETDKVNVDVEAPAPGRLARIVAPDGTVVAPGQVLAEIEPE